MQAELQLSGPMCVATDGASKDLVGAYSIVVQRPNDQHATGDASEDQSPYRMELMGICVALQAAVHTIARLASRGVAPDFGVSVDYVLSFDFLRETFYHELYYARVGRLAVLLNLAVGSVLFGSVLSLFDAVVGHCLFGSLLATWLTPTSGVAPGCASQPVVGSLLSGFELLLYDAVVGRCVFFDLASCLRLLLAVLRRFPD
eukprot:s6984_g2.t1